MAIILVDGSSQDKILGIRDATWGAAACVAPQSRSLIRSGYDSVVTFRLEKGDCASAEAYAIIAGARLLRRCGTYSSDRCGAVVVAPCAKHLSWVLGDNMAWFLEICFDVWPAPGALYGTPLHPLSQHRVLLFYAISSLRKNTRKYI